jgi:hypothetical protein
MKHDTSGHYDNCIGIDDSFNIDDSRADSNEFRFNRPTLEGNKIIQNINENCDDDDDDSNIVAAIYRYKFTQDFMDELYKFSKVHQYDDRAAFKEAWEEWVEDEEKLIETETTRLQELGYDGDILDKMFKSARYYFRKKSTSKPEPKQRRKYIGVQKEFLDIMDSHISRGLTNDDYKPSDGFNNFCINNVDSLKTEVARLLENEVDSNEIMNKIKKTYKNRYFMIISK